MPKTSNTAVEQAATLTEPMFQLSPSHIMNGHSSMINSCSYSADGRLIVSSSDDGSVRLWHAATGKQVADFQGHCSDMVRSCAFIPRNKVVSTRSCSDIKSSKTKNHKLNSQALVVSASDEDIKIWGAVDGKAKATVSLDSEGFLTGCVLSPAGDKLLSVMDDQCITLSKIGGDEEEEDTNLEGHEGSAKSYCFSADGSVVMTASSDGTIKIWDSEDGEEILSIDGHTKSVWKAVFSPNNERILSCSADETVRIWDRFSGKPLGVMDSHEGPVHLCTYSPNGRWAASADSKKVIKLWNGEDGAELATLEGHEDYIWNIEFSPDSMLLVSTSCTGRMLIWSMPGGELVASLDGHKEGVKSIAFAPSGHTLVSSSHDNSLMLWNISGCYYPTYVQEMTKALESRTKNMMHPGICGIIAEYAWPTCVKELEYEIDVVESDEEEDFTPVRRKRLHSCKF